MVDLCAGVGGIRKGFEMTGEFETVLSAEVDKYAIETYKHLYGEDPTNDITSDEFKELVRDTDYDILLAGFPCQAFSRAGKQEGFLDTTRGTLFFDIAEMLRDSKPNMFLLENVDNLLTHDKGNTFNTILSILVKELDYTVVGVEEDTLGNIVWERSSFIRNSRDFGVPQNRPRVYIIGFSNDTYGEGKLRDIIEPLPLKREGVIYKDLEGILDKGVPAKYYLAEGMFNTLKEHKERHTKAGNGFGYQIVNEPSRPKPHVSSALLATGGSGKERNLVIDSKQYAGEMVGSKQTPINNEGVRNMTPNEWAKLQGFKGWAFVDENGVDHFSFPEKMSDTQRYKQMGNSVAIPVINELAKYVIRMLGKLNGGV